jgi:DNA polymerase III subunit epsilon
MANETGFRWIGRSIDGDSVHLRRYKGEFSPPEFATPQWLESHPDLVRVGAVLDVETTGREARADKIIEIGIRLFRFHKETGEVLSRDEGYGALEDPGEPLKPEIIRITGITDAMLAGQKIDWSKVSQLMEASQIILAHNASFDRPFVDKKVGLSAKKIWGCSFKQVDWPEKGFPSQKLEILAIYHGFFSTAHRALADADTLLHLISMADPQHGEPYLKELLANARKKVAQVFAVYSPIETKDLLKNRAYRWDPEKRVWSKSIFLEEVEAEKAWLSENVYSGRFRGEIRELELFETFRS